MSVLASWSNFYVMTGGAAAALTGLMFVVITLVFGGQRPQPPSDGISTFSTPTVVYFGFVLLVSAILIAPWASLTGPALLLGFFGLGGIVHMVRTMGRARRLQEYQPDIEDWAWFAFLPLVAYFIIFAGALDLIPNAPKALFAIAAGIVLLMAIGIRNSWDVVTYLASSHE